MKKLVLITCVVSGMAFTGCTTPGKKTGYGAGIGAVVGAGLGALANKKDRKKGALIGAAAGLALGGGVGNYLDKQAKELAQIAETKRTENGIVTNLQGDILFATGSATLKPEAQASISKISSIIKKYPEDVITVMGHTDSTGSDTLNQKLSERRAATVRGLMISEGVPAGSISMVGMGEASPRADNNTNSGRQQNRRVELQITVPQPPQ